MMFWRAFLGPITPNICISKFLASCLAEYWYIVNIAQGDLSVLEHISLPVDGNFTEKNIFLIW